MQVGMPVEELPDRLDGDNGGRNRRSGSPATSTSSCWFRAGCCFLPASCAIHIAATSPAGRTTPASSALPTGQRTINCCRFRWRAIRGLSSSVGSTPRGISEAVRILSDGARHLSPFLPPLRI